MQLSPYLPHHPPPTDPVEQAADIRAALAAHADGTEPAGPVVALAEPSSPGIEADADALLAVSRTFARGG